MPEADLHDAQRLLHARHRATGGGTHPRVANRLVALHAHVQRRDKCRRRAPRRRTTRSVNASTDRSTSTSTGDRQMHRRQRDERVDGEEASSTPSAPPAAASNRLSVNICRTRRPVVLPIARRIDISRSRADAAREEQIHQVRRGDQQQHDRDRQDHDERLPRALRVVSSFERAAAPTTRRSDCA